MKEKVREFNYKWQDKDKSEPLMWESGGPGGGKKLCWHDMDELQLTHYLRDSEMEIRDRLHQMEHLIRCLINQSNRMVVNANLQDSSWKRIQQYWIDDCRAST